MVCEKVCTAFLTFCALWPELFKCSGVNLKLVLKSSGPNFPTPGPFQPFWFKMLTNSWRPSLMWTLLLSLDGTRKPLWKTQWFLALFNTWGASGIKKEAKVCVKYRKHGCYFSHLKLIVYFLPIFTPKIKKFQRITSKLSGFLISSQAIS